MAELLNPGSRDILKKAGLRGTLIPMHRLAISFPAEEEAFVLAYQQSESFIEFIEGLHGKGTLKNIIRRLSEAQGFHESIRAETGVGVKTLEEAWQDSLKQRYSWLGYVSDNIYFILFLAGALLTLGAFLRLRKRIRDYPEDEERESNEDVEFEPPEEGRD